MDSAAIKPRKTRISGRKLNEDEKVCRRYFERIGTSPLKAIRAHCVQCCGGSPADVAKCASILCPLHSFRSGRRPTPAQARTWLKAMNETDVG